MVSPVYSSNTHDETTVTTRRQTAQHTSPDPIASEAATRTPSAAHTRTIDTAGCEVSSQPSTPIASMKLFPVSPTTRDARLASQPPGRETRTTAAPSAANIASAVIRTIRPTWPRTRSRHNHLADRPPRG